MDNSTLFKTFLIKYAEIGIKGKNRFMFEDALVRQIRFALKRVEGEFKVYKTQGRIFVDVISEEYDYDDTVEALQTVFGISGICPVVHVEDQGIEQLGKDVVEYMRNVHPDTNTTFKVFSRRSK